MTKDEDDEDSDDEGDDQEAEESDEDDEDGYYDNDDDEVEEDTEKPDSTFKQGHSSLFHENLKSGGKTGSSSNFPPLLKRGITDVMKMVYGEAWLQSNYQASEGQTSGQLVVHQNEEDDDDQDDFFTVKKNKAGSNSYQNEDSLNCIDSSRFVVQSFKTGNEKFRKFENYKSHRNVYQLIKQRFVTGGWKSPITAKTSNENSEAEGDAYGDDDSEIVDGDFVDLEAEGAQQHDFNSKHSAKSRASRGDGDDDDDDESVDSDDSEQMEKRNEKIDEELRAINAQKKAAFKSSFDDTYDRKKSVRILLFINTRLLNTTKRYCKFGL